MSRESNMDAVLIMFEPFMKPKRKLIYKSGKESKSLEEKMKDFCGQKWFATCPKGK